MYGLKDPEEILEETKNRLGRIPTVPEVTTKDLEELDELKKLQKKLSALRKKDIVAKVSPRLLWILGARRLGRRVDTRLS
ncbi:hypothetical protein ARMGADRAFT_1013617 [Armillaria gallica]|uniref:Uncharacterized protein n=1 Tax=Armillaria gallica TaxID=47427 RepID=A0A2H3DRU7_ARMGA|nr:hypothetical protein ARMGADRAFT_1013617 [Armillaria gallica]